MSRGHASVQLYAERQRHTPVFWFMMFSRCCVASSRLSKMNRCACTIAAGPRYEPFTQKIGQLVVQHAHRMQWLDCAISAASASDWMRSAAGAGDSLMKY